MLSRPSPLLPGISRPARLGRWHGLEAFALPLIPCWTVRGSFSPSPIWQSISTQCQQSWVWSWRLLHPWLLLRSSPLPTTDYFNTVPVYSTLFKLGLGLRHQAEMADHYAHASLSLNYRQDTPWQTPCQGLLMPRRVAILFDFGKDCLPIDMGLETC